MMTHNLRKMLAATGIAASLVLAGCTSGGGGTTTDNEKGVRPAEETGPVTIKFVWWGNDTRNQLTNQVLDMFQDKYPSITVERETADYNSYWQKTATEIAAGNGPDVMQMDATYVQQYASDGNVLDLESIGIDLPGYSQASIDAGRVNGTLYAATFCVNVPVMLANPLVFQQAGVDLPDDSTWTWDDFAALTEKIGAAGGSDYYGATSRNDWDGMLTLWVRQLGKQQYLSDGSLGFTADDLTSMFEYWLGIQDAGGTPPATVQVEDDQADLSMTLFATNRSAITMLWSNMVVALDNATGQDLVILQPPSRTGSEKDADLWLKSSQFLVIGQDTKHRDASLKLLEYLATDPDAGKILGTERGIPASSNVISAIEPTLTPSDQKVVDFMDKVADNLGVPNGLPLPGGSQSQTLQYQYGQAVLLKSSTPAQAAAGFLADLKKQMDLQ